MQQAAQRSIALNAQAVGAQHSLTRRMCVECHDELAAVAQGTPINPDTVPALYNIVRRLRFISIVERGVEGLHARICLLYPPDAPADLTRLVLAGL